MRRAGLWGGCGGAVAGGGGGGGGAAQAAAEAEAVDRRPRRRVLVPLSCDVLFESGTVGEPVSISLRGSRFAGHRHMGSGGCCYW